MDGVALAIDMAQSDMTACYVVYGCMKSYNSSHSKRGICAKC